MNDIYIKAAEAIKNSKRVCVFSGAGISVESGIPPFRGEGGLWSKYDLIFLDITYFKQNPLESWKLIKEIFYDFFGQAKPNDAHFGVTKLQKAGYVGSIITQNIDNLHQESGSINVLEYHGTASKLECMSCKSKFETSKELIETLPPSCPKCGGLLKPDFVFFGEPIPEPAASLSTKETEISDVFILIGTSGEIMPASLLPNIAKSNGATIIEINVTTSNYTDVITDFFLQDKATAALNKLTKILNL
jgi:NAD-dependent deacetylase